MSQIETNIFEIENLDELSCKYRLYRVKGLDPDSEDFEKNVRILVDSLSRRKDEQSPCEPVYINGKVFIAQPDGYPELPNETNLVRTTVKLEKIAELKELDFKSLNSTTSKLAIRFLQFALQTPLYNNPKLWQPQAGHPFFHKAPDKNFRGLSKDIDLFRGFTFRIIAFGDGKLGVCVDTTSKYISRYYLPTDIERDEFRKKYRDYNCLYEYGNRWYEIKLSGMNDLKANEVLLPDGKTLFEHVHEHAGSRKSPTLCSLPKDCSVLFYKNSRNEQRNVPSGLCRLTFGTQHESIKYHHSKTIKFPDKRYGEIQFIVDAYLRDLKFGEIKIKFSKKPLSIEEQKILVPDLEFGKNKVLSVRRTPGTVYSTLKDFGKNKKSLMYTEDAGIYSKKPFDKQYVFLPHSVLDTFGNKFVENLKEEAEKIFSHDSEIYYDPTVIGYDDSVQRSAYQLGNQILKTIEQLNLNPGFGVVMIPNIPSTHVRKEDILENLLMKKLREKGIYVSIIHTSVAQDSFEDTSNEEQSNWSLVSDYKQRGIYKGYVHNVVLNKILLLNNYWPFVLKTQLNADLIIGIDVKHRTAGFTLVYKNGSNIRFEHCESKQKEQLSRNQMKTKLLEIMRPEDVLPPQEIKKVVIHRDGMFFKAEVTGIKQAFNILAREGLVHKDVQCTFVDIRKTSRVPLRMFKIVKQIGQQEEKVYNPYLGTYIPITENEYFICTTGYPFRHKGTSKPLHIIKVEGDMPTQEIMEDVFYLSNLTWTKIDDCSRYPLTIKMTDMRLREFAGEFDKDALEFGDD